MEAYLFILKLTQYAQRLLESIRFRI